MALSDLDILNYAAEHGIISVATIEKQIEMNKREEYLKKHKREIWEREGIYYTYVPCATAKRGIKLLKRKSRKDLDDAIIACYKGLETEPYLEDVYQEWITRKIEYGEIEKQTANRYETDFERFLKNSELAKIKFKLITENVLEDFVRKTISEYELTSKSWANLRVLINGIFKFGKKRGYTNISITSFMGDLELSKRVFKKQVVEASTKVFTDSEEELIMETLRNEDFTLLVVGVIAGFQTGLRCGELSALRWSDIHEDYISVTKTEVRYKDKNGKYVFAVREFPKTDAGVRDIVILPETRELFRKTRHLNPFGEYVFMKNGNRIPGKRFTDKLYRTCDKAKIGRRSMHKARMTYGTQLIDAKVPDSIIQEQMGHVDIETTRRYYYYNNRDRKETQALLKDALYTEKVTQKVTQVTQVTL